MSPSCVSERRDRFFGSEQGEIMAAPGAGGQGRFRRGSCPAGRLQSRYRLAEKHPREEGRGDCLDEDHQRRESRRQSPERVGEEALAADVADQGEGDQGIGAAHACRQQAPFEGNGDDEEELPP